MDSEGAFKWLNNQVVTPHSPLKRFLVQAVFYLLALAALYGFLLLKPQRFYEGQVIPYTILSPVEFDYVNTETLEVLKGEGTVKIVDDAKSEQARARLDQFESEFSALRLGILRDEIEETEKTARISELAQQFGLDPSFVAVLVNYNEDELDDVFVRARYLLGKDMENREVTEEYIRTLKQGGLPLLMGAPENVYVYFLMPNLLDVPRQDLSEDYIAQALEPIEKGDVLAAEGSRLDRQSAAKLSEIANLTEGFYLKPQNQQALNEYMLAVQGERKAADVKAELARLQRELMHQRYLRFLGVALVLLAVFLLWHLSGKRFAPRLLSSVGSIAQMGTIFIIFLVAGLVIGRLPFNFFYYGVTLAVTAAAVAVVMVYDSLFGLYMGLGLALMLSLALNFGANLMLYTLAGALLPSILLAPGCHRLKQVIFALAIGLLNAALAAMVILTSSQVWHWQVFPIAFLAGFGAAIVGLGLLPVIETLSAQLTPGKLIELANPENELLRRLKREAHGTYVHSQMVADLTEEACKEIGGDWLQAKVGALYHDIGKLKRHGFFAENIHDLKRNPHENLPPETSVKILKDHVTDGLMMARESNLPKELHKYINEHHGTYLIKYFYYKALRLHEQDAAKYAEPALDEFCYNGPIPQNRESGVVMLADVTEAIVRARVGANADEIRHIIDQVVAEKIAENQLVASDLTVGDLKAVKEAFARILIAQRHHRVRYPAEVAAPVHFHFMDKELPHASTTAKVVTTPADDNQ